MNEGNRRMELLGSAPIPKALLAMGLPAMIGMTVSYTHLEGRPVILSLSSAYIGLFQYKTRGQVKDALLKLGFTDVRDTAEAAAMATGEYVKLLEKGDMKNIITTACPSIVSLIEIHYPELIDYLAPVLIPSGIHARMLGEEYGEEARIVFAGPCIAEKEKMRAVSPDAVLTFEELKGWLEEEEIKIDECEDADFDERHLGAKDVYKRQGQDVRLFSQEDSG